VHKLLLAAVLVSVVALSEYSCNKPKVNEPEASAHPTPVKNTNSFISSGNFRELDAKTSLNSSSPYLEYYPCNLQGKSSEADKLTKTERMLVFGYEQLDEYNAPFNPAKRFEPVTTLSGMLVRYYAVHESLPKSTDDLFECYNSFYKDEIAKEGKTKEEVKKDFDNMLRSPITGKPLEWQNPNFSAGNVFITIVNDNPEALKYAETEFAKSLSEYKDQAKPMFDGLRVYLYCRVYGESNIIDNIQLSKFWTNEQITDMKTKIGITE
jgi:hypothetical protein